MERDSSLQVEVPENFGPLKELSNPVVEFIPRNQNRNNWTQMVTTQVIINERRNAQTVTTYLKNGINQIATEVHLVEESSINRSDILNHNLGSPRCLIKDVSFFLRIFFWPSRLRRIPVFHVREPRKSSKLMRLEKLENLRRIKLDCLLFSKEYMKSK